MSLSLLISRVSGEISRFKPSVLPSLITLYVLITDNAFLLAAPLAWRP